MYRFYILFTCLLTGIKRPVITQIQEEALMPEITAGIIPAAERSGLYLPLLKIKREAIFANQTSMIGNKSDGRGTDKPFELFGHPL